MTDTCTFGKDCGKSGHYSDENTFCKIYQCTKSTQSHLGSLCCENDVNIPEGVLILYRSGLFNVDVTTLNLKVCQKHRDELGIYWRRHQRSCQSPFHANASKSKPDRGVQAHWSKDIWLHHRILVPVGSGKKGCPDCRKKYVEVEYIRNTTKIKMMCIYVCIVAISVNVRWRKK